MTSSTGQIKTFQLVCVWRQTSILAFDILEGEQGNV